MAIRPITLEKTMNTEEVLTISKSGINFSAVFMKNNNLTQMESIGFFMNDQDPFWFGFKFYDNAGASSTLALMKSGRGDNVSNGRTVKATELFNKNKVLKAIQKLETKHSRIFEVLYDKFEKCFYVLLRPSFEHSTNPENIASVQSDVKGIYRYFDHENKIIYIGKGNIRERLNTPERSDWGINKIEFSIIEDNDSMYKWESYYLEIFQNEHGRLPIFNRIKGHSL